MLDNLKPADVRALIRSGRLKKATAGIARGYVQANIIILPAEQAADFWLFCRKNPQPCALIEVLDAGNPYPKMACRQSDIREDIGCYRIYNKGVLTGEVDNIHAYWRPDLVSFLLGCSFTFENALLAAGIPARHIAEKKRVPMYVTNIKCKKVNGIEVNMVVSMRPIKKELVAEAVQITSRYPAMHGAPVHIGDPAAIGLLDLAQPDFGDPVEIYDGEVPVFWACGGTVFKFAEKMDCDLVITHAPSHMYVLDLRDDEFLSF